MNCEESRAAMDAQFEGELSPQLAEPLRAHLTTCASCRERSDRLGRVELALERGGLSEQRRDALEARILGKATVVAQPAPPPTRRAGWMTVLAAAVVVLLAAIPAWFATREDPFTPRGGGESWGVRAFCVIDGRVTGEALAGGTLRCAPGSLVQFTYTAPEAAQLSISLQESNQRFFPVEGQRAQVDAGIDVALPSSTPLGAWLTGPQRVTARFTDARGTVLAESWLVVTP